MDPVKDANGWTGGQWSLVRVTLAIGGGALLASTVRLLPIDSWAGADRLLSLLGLCLVGLDACIGFSRVSAALWFLLAGVALAITLYPDELELAAATGRGVAHPSPSMVACWLLIVLLFRIVLISPAPFGSMEARKRAEPGGGWSMPRSVHLLAAVSWLAYMVSLMIVLMVFVGLWRPNDWWYTQHTNWLGLFDDRPVPDLPYTAPPTLLIPLYWFARPARPFIWLATFAFLVVTCWWFGWWLVLAFGALFALLAFDPGWIRPRLAGTTDTLFYDGGCGLCHASVRFVLAEDRSGTAFIFAPIGGAAWRETFPEERAAPVNTLVVRTARGETLSRSSGALYIARHLGGFWRVLGTLGVVIPRPLRDAVYRFIAGIRHRLFRAPSDACPLVSPDLQRRFDLRP